MNRRLIYQDYLLKNKLFLLLRPIKLFASITDYTSSEYTTGTTIWSFLAGDYYQKIIVLLKYSKQEIVWYETSITLPY